MTGSAVRVTSGAVRVISGAVHVFWRCVRVTVGAVRVTSGAVRVTGGAVRAVWRRVRVTGGAVSVTVRVDWRRCPRGQRLPRSSGHMARCCRLERRRRCVLAFIWTCIYGHVFVVLPLLICISGHTFLDITF